MLMTPLSFASDILFISMALFVGGLLFSLILWGISGLARKLGLLLSLLASIAMVGGGVLALLGFTINPVIIASFQPVGTFGFGMDALSGFFAIILGIGGISASIYSLGYLDVYERKGYSIPKFVFLFNLFLIAMLGVITAQNAFAFIVFWELMTLSSFYLVTFENRENAAKRSGFTYMLMAHFGTACLIIMYLILAAGAGSFNFSAFTTAQYLSVARDFIFVLALVGFGIKAGVIPFHIWLPVAHPKAPSNISALMSGIMLKTAIYGMVRVIFGFLAVGVTPPPFWWGVLLLAIGIVSAILGVLYSLMEHDMKILLAYHSIENIGIIVIGLGAAVLFSYAGLTLFAAVALFAALYHTLNHSLFKNLLFTGAGSVMYSTGTSNIDELGGLTKRMPMTSLLFLIGAASIAALPPLNGFVSEWLTFIALFGGIGAIKAVSFTSVVAILGLALTSALAVAAFIKAFGIPFSGTPRSNKVSKARDPPASMIIGMVILAIACILAGLFPSILSRATVPILVQLNMKGAAGIVPVASSLPILYIFGALVLMVALVLILLKVLQAVYKTRIRRDITWGCGQPEGDGTMQYSAKGFSMPIVRALNFAIAPLGKRRNFGHQFFETVVYAPIEKFYLRVASWSRIINTGKLMHYLVYLLITLMVVLLFALA